MTESRDYVLVDKFGGTGGALRQGAKIQGDYSSTAGYWSNLPCWDVRDDYCWLMRKLKRNFSCELKDDYDDEE